ncbi:hypothetical protein ACXDF8_13395 [Mycolicibacterium sp. CBM1]
MSDLAGDELVIMSNPLFANKIEKEFMMKIRLRHLAPLIAAGAAATAIAVAPPAAAISNTTTCNEKGAASVCQRQGHSSIHVSPPVRPNQPFGFGTGFGPINPLWLLG